MGVSSDILVNALDGLNRAEAKLEKTTERLARVADPASSPVDEVNLTDEVVNLLQAKNSYEANLKSLETANEMQKHLIDVFA